MSPQGSETAASEKPKLTVDCSGGGTTVLEALNRLSWLKEGASRHEVLDRRHPLGIYNLSIGRICEKVRKCAEALERYSALSNLEDLDKSDVIRSDILDCLELSLYAAAEHIDDVELISGCFFESPREYSKSKHVRELKRVLKPLRDQISSFTNAIKHKQGRIRLFSMEFEHGGNNSCLHGFFIEVFNDGGAGPCPNLHQNAAVISITSFLWGMIVYLFLISNQISAFLDEVGAVKEGVTAVDSAKLRKAVISLSRLPLYTFDEKHPFELAHMAITSDEESDALLQSDIYGSIRCPWSMSADGRFGSTRLMYEGDGVTRSFKLVAPRNLQLRHWRRPGEDG